MDTSSHDLARRHAGGSSSNSQSKKKKRPCGQLRSSSSSAHVSSAELGRGHRVKEEQKELRHVIQSIMCLVFYLACDYTHTEFLFHAPHLYYNRDTGKQQQPKGG